MMGFETRARKHTMMSEALESRRRDGANAEDAHWSHASGGERMESIQVALATGWDQDQRGPRGSRQAAAAGGSWGTGRAGCAWTVVHTGVHTSPWDSQLWDEAEPACTCAC